MSRLALELAVFCTTTRFPRDLASSGPLAIRRNNEGPDA